MSLQKLLEKFDRVRELPIEVTELRDAVVALGYQDHITFIPCDEMDPKILRGVFYQFTTRATVYGDTQLHTLIIYSSKMSLEWQRLVCAKELIHVMDQGGEKTDTQEEVEGLIEKLIGPLSSEDYGLSDLMAARDKIAVYQALALLFPDAARADALKLLQSGALTIEQIAERACLPGPFVRMVLRGEWPELKKEICAA